jgi:hypothetical protein
VGMFTSVSTRKKNDLNVVKIHVIMPCIGNFDEMIIAKPIKNNTGD